MRKRKWWPISENVCELLQNIGHIFVLCVYLRFCYCFPRIVIFNTIMRTVIPSDQCSSTVVGISLVDLLTMCEVCVTVWLIMGHLILFLFCIHTAHSRKNSIVVSNNKTDVCLFSGSGRRRETEIQRFLCSITLSGHTLYTVYTIHILFLILDGYLKFVKCRTITIVTKLVH